MSRKETKKLKNYIFTVRNHQFGSKGTEVLRGSSNGVWRNSFISSGWFRPKKQIVVNKLYMALNGIVIFRQAKELYHIISHKRNIVAVK